MSQTISEFHYAAIFIEGNALASAEALHDELAFKLGLPIWHGRNWNALLAALSSIGKPSSKLCANWEFLTGKRMVLQIRRFSADSADRAVLNSLLQIVAEANNRLLIEGHGIRIWLELCADTQ
jgi:hypothetical protein